jgi:PBP1b-binding outer membrane lipoprotein LpoB
MTKNLITVVFAGMLLTGCSQVVTDVEKLGACLKHDTSQLVQKVGGAGFGDTGCPYREEE